MTANTVDDDVDSSAASEGKNNDPTSEIASLRERLMRALSNKNSNSSSMVPCIKHAPAEPAL